jgi:hydrogenase/urease accessory protein HupE
MIAPSLPPWFAGWLVMVALVSVGFAHDEPTSFIDLHLSSSGMEVSATASVTDIAHSMPGVEPDALLRPATLEVHREEISASLLGRLKITGDGAPVAIKLERIEAVPEKRDLRVTFSSEWSVAPAQLHVDALLFPYDPRHRTFVNVWSGEDLLRQETLKPDRLTADFATSRHQSLGGVFVEFVKQGIHHIFIGPDHILFVIGLLLLGGTVTQLMKIVTAFTIAHSITLALATFRLVTPPAAVVEPVIALSIVCVGLSAFFGKRAHDPRLLFAFCFGLVHGFGFASVLQEMVLPRQAMGVSLFAFNFGVEIAQALIVVTIAPLLAFVRNRSVRVSDSVVASGALLITAAGAFWFFQRVLG